MMKWDKLKIDIKKGTDSLKTGMKKVVKQAVTEVDVLKLKYEREKVKRELSSVYQKIGELVFDIAAEGKKDILKDPDINRLFNEVSRLEEIEKRLDAEISETREYVKVKKEPQKEDSA